MQRPTNDIDYAGALESSVRKGNVCKFHRLEKAYNRVDRGKLWGGLKGM